MLEPIDLIAGQLRDAAIDPAGWTTVLDSINAFVRGAGAAILSVEERLRHAPCSSDLTELMEDYFRDGWYANDRREGCIPLLLHKGIALDHEFTTVDERDPFYAEFLGRHNRKWFAGLGANLEENLWCLTLQRSSAQGAFLNSDMPRLQAVRERLEDAASLSRIVARSWLAGAISALDGVGTAAIVLSRAGRILEMNEAARSIVCRPLRSQTTKVFEDALISRLLDARWDSSRTAQISLEFAQKNFALEVTPLRERAGLISLKASTLVRIRPQSLDPQSILQIEYRLTKSEARVAMALASGMSVQAMAEAFSVSQNTIRMQLKATYAKTEVGSQARLVALIAKLGMR